MSFAKVLHLEPLDIATESLCGLIMAMSIAGSVSISTTGANVVPLRSIIYATLGANLAWGLIDGVMAIMAEMQSRLHFARVSKSLREASNSEDFNSILLAEIPQQLAHSARGHSQEKLFKKRASIFHTSKTKLRTGDYIAGVSVVLLFLISTVPVILPLLLIDDRWWARRISEIVSSIFLFVLGALIARHTQYSTWRLGFCTMALGICLSVLCMILGG